jgi:PAS domain S-box-containing protein
MFDEIEDYAIVSLDANGYIRNWNKGASLIKGYSAHEIIGRHFRIFYTPDDISIQKPEQLIAQAIQTGKAKEEGWRVRKDGTRFWSSMLITAIHDDEGQFIGFTKVTRDLTERMLAEKASLKRLEELDMINRDLEQFVYIASHDLQEPLLTISNFIELIQTEYASVLSKDAQAAAYIEFIANASHRLRSLIKGLLDYSRIGKERLDSEVDFNHLLDTLLEDMEATISAAQATIRYHQLPVGKGFETELRQLFQNLLSNAIKFRREGVPPVIEITAEKEGNSWKFMVRDNGIGIDERYKEKIFMIFQRLHNRNEYEGNGIGLAHCKKIVEMHKGVISVESQQGKGSTFYFTLSA